MTFKFSPKIIFISFILIFTKNIKQSFKDKIFLCRSMTYILNIIDDLEKNRLSSNLEIFCSFFNSHKDEDILDYYSQKHYMKSFTL